MEKMDELMDEKNITEIIKAKALKRYGPGSAQTDQYIEIAEKFIKRNQYKMAISIDAV